MRAAEFLTETITPNDLTHLRYYLIDLFEPFGLDFKFSSHFLDRANDLRNKKPITPGELSRLFRKVLKQHGRSIVGLAPNIEVVLKDLATKINVPVAILPPESEDDARTIVAKTVMRKQDFKTTNPTFAIESLASADQRVYYVARHGSSQVGHAIVNINEQKATVVASRGINLAECIRRDLLKSGIQNVIISENAQKKGGRVPGVFRGQEEGVTKGHAR